MNGKVKQAFRGLVAELRDVIPQKDQVKLEQLERIVGELRRERSGLVAKVAELGTQLDSKKTEATNAKSATQTRIATLQKGFAQTEKQMRQQIAEREQTITTLSQRSDDLHAGLYPIATDLLFITKKQLIEANQESIRLGYNRNIKEEFLVSLPDQKYVIEGAFYHIGFSGREFEQLNYRLMLMLCTKPASPLLTGADMEHEILDVSADWWDGLRSQSALAEMTCRVTHLARNQSDQATAQQNMIA